MIRNCFLSFFFLHFFLGCAGVSCVGNWKRNWSNGWTNQVKNGNLPFSWSHMNVRFVVNILLCLPLQPFQVPWSGHFVHVFGIKPVTSQKVWTFNASRWSVLKKGIVTVIRNRVVCCFLRSILTVYLTKSYLETSRMWLLIICAVVKRLNININGTV